MISLTNLRKYSRVNQAMQTVSIMASLGFSTSFPFPSIDFNCGIVLITIPTIETATKDIDITETTWILEMKTITKENSHLGCCARLWLLHEVPDHLLVFCKLAIPKIILLLLLHLPGVALHLLNHQLPLPNELVVAAAVQVVGTETPIVEILSKGKDTHLVGQVQLSRSIEVEDGVEGPGVAVEEELVLDDGVIAAEGDDLLVGSSSGEKSQS